LKKKILQMEHITKSFPGVKALDDVCFDLYEGEVHALMGENGAGKSTLMKILGGSYQQDTGDILLDGNKVTLDHPVKALQSGIAMIYQELNPIPYMTVAENIFLGKELVTKSRLVDKRRMHKETQVLLDLFEVKNVQPADQMCNLSIAETQMIEIIKAYSFHAKILIMDEPTSSLSDHEVDKLFNIVAMLKEQKVGIIYISHKIEEILKISDRITVLRDGRYIDTKESGQLEVSEIIKMMVNRDITRQFPYEKKDIGDEILKVVNLTGNHFSNISFSLRKGEILGFSGLVGAGRTEAMEAIFGLRRIFDGDIYIKGKKVSVNSPKGSIRNKIALISEDRKLKGLNLKGSVKTNMTISVLSQFENKGVINKKKENEAVANYIDKISIKTPTPDQIVNYLSGGNQQKVVIAKCLMAEPEIIIFDEPTRGIDVGSKEEIYKMIMEFAKQGKATIFISSELPELMGVTDRIIVMHEGKITGELPRDEFNQEKIMSYAIAENRGI